MTKLSIGQAAKQWGFARGTLYAAIKSGKISVTKDSRGHKQIDAAEMVRVYGEPAPKQVTTEAPTMAIDLLQKQIDILERELKQARDREDRLNNQIDHLNARLEHKETPPPEQPKQKKKGIFARVADAVLDK